MTDHTTLTDGELRECITPGCDEQTYNGHGRCRDCDVEYLMDRSTCVRCGKFAFNQFARDLGFGGCRCEKPVFRDELPPDGVRVVQSFFDDNDRRVALEYASTLSYEPGRQATGYEKATVPAALGVDHPVSLLRTRCLAELQRGHPGHVLGDCYVLRCPAGSYLPPHKDPAPPGFSHERINVLLTPAANGGAFFVSLGNAEATEMLLAPGDAVVFRPDLHEHLLTEVMEGEARMVFSVGVLR